MIKDEKKEWKKPIMTVVAKSTSEENVLDTCKGAPDQGWPYGGPQGVTFCMNDWTNFETCNATQVS